MSILTKLLTVKSIVTIALTAVVCYLAIRGLVDVTGIYLTIVAFYFGTQHEKSKKED